MNVTDVEAPAPLDTWLEKLAAIFVRQGELMEKYRDIERLPVPPLSVHHADSQRVMKDFAWRTTEELAEADEASTKHGDDQTNLEHCFEELADALHFFVELLIFAGITPEQCVAAHPYFPQASGLAPHEVSWDFIRSLGLSMNFLRNKPWKQSQVPTDEARFREQLLDSYIRLLDLFATRGMTEDDVFNFYFRKSEVNRFRQRSNY